ncbi:YD repeat-containing protein [Luteibacter sp. OK325]|nr:YD repeat-containing protein [Luteibacter sp. OK325]
MSLDVHGAEIYGARNLSCNVPSGHETNQGITGSVRCTEGGRRRFGVRLASLFLLGALVAPLLPSVALAQTMATPEEDYKKLIKVNEDIQPLGDTPFGERIGLHDGSLSFEQVDVSVSGRGPTITVGRELFMHGAEDRPDLQNRAFADWDMSLPEIATVTANQTNVRGWQVAADNQNAICTNFREPPVVSSTKGYQSWDAVTWWQGYQLRIPGQGNQDLLRRYTTGALTPTVNGLVYNIFTKGNWTIGCLAHASNDSKLEGFLAVSPDGTKYWLDHVSYRYMPASTRAGGSAGPEDIVSRREGRMLVTRIEDRFGNAITYTYNAGGDLVTNIDSEDRHVAIGYESGTSRISTVTVQGGASGSRTWTYGYARSAGLGYTLTSVRQPDGSSWNYSLDPISRAVVDTSTTVGSCTDIGIPTNMGASYSGSITHPSGLSARYTVTPLKRGRSYVPKACNAGPGQPSGPTTAGTWADIPNASFNLAITQRVLSGTGLPSSGLVWNYAYSAPNASWSNDCAAGCVSTVYTDVTYPDGHAERSTFSNRYDWTETQLLSEEVFDGQPGTAVRRRTSYGYVNPDVNSDGRASAYLHSWGDGFQYRANTTLVNEQIPMARRVTVLDPANPSPDTFTWNASAFDAFARPTDVQRSSSMGYAISERTSFVDDAAHWVLGLPDTSYNLTSGETVSRNVYNMANMTLSERYRFGRRVMAYTFNERGELASFTDGNNNVTQLGAYKRGIPGSIVFPDHTGETIAVDDFGQIASITNQVGATTSYSYDGIGRVARIDYPTGDTVAWTPRIFSYSYSGDARGMGGNHWVRLITQGTYSQRTDFDALLRPVMSGKAEANSGALYVSARTEYDWKGRKTFESYPVDGAQDRGSIGLGVATAYDALGRAVSTTQASELGNLVTTTQYLPGGTLNATDAKGNTTSSRFQMFDEPSYDSVVRVDAPEGATQIIVRDTYGNPLSLSQGGITKTMAYDSEHRLCRSWEPETGSEVMGYDGAGNLAWSVSGQPFNGAGCGYDDANIAAAPRTTRSYDAMNRVTAVSYPNGALATTFAYDGTGNPQSAVSLTSTGSAGNSGVVTWTYGRNKRGLLTAEVLAIDGWSWPLTYDYDTNGNLRSTQYPDGQIVPYGPNALGQATVASPYASAAQYFPDGALKSHALGNGLLYSADKNTRGALSNFTYGTASNLVVSQDYSYDKVGNVTSISDRVGSGQRSRSMSYDGLNRLTSASASQLWGTENYTYDTLNNIRALSNNGVARTYNYNGNNLLASITGTGTNIAFAYDERGNTVARGSQILNFDKANRLLSITGSGEYMYDAAGRRAKKVTPSGTTYYAYNSAGQLMWDVDTGSRIGTDYVYLGKKLVAKSSDSIDKLQSREVSATLAIVGVPHLSVDGTTIDVTIDIGNSGSRTLTSSTQYPVHLGNHVYDGSGNMIKGDVERFNIPDIAPGAHGTTTIHMASAAVLGNGRRFRIDLVQEGVSWFEGWGTRPLEIGPYSTCPTAGTGNLCNNETGLIPSQLGIAMAFVSAPQLTADGQNVTATIDVANNGTVTLAPGGSHPINLGYHLMEASGSESTVGTVRATLPEIAPGTHAAVTILVPSSQVVGTGRTLRFVPVQEMIAWLDGMGVATLNAGPYAKLAGSNASANGAVALSWGAMPGATTYNLRESLNGGVWTTVSASSATSWSGGGRVTGSYSYQVQACATGCSTWSPSFVVNVLLPPPAPASVTATAPIPGPITLTWSGSSTATYYVLQSQFNGGGWVTLGNVGGTSWSTGVSSSGTYAYRLQACNASGCSGFTGSNAVGITLPPASAPGIAGGGTSTSGAYTISWTGVAGATGYNLGVSVNGGGLQGVQYNGATSWSTSGMGNASYAYQVQACNAGGCGPWSGVTTVNVTLLPLVPAQPRISQTGSSAKPVVIVTWSATAYAARYEVLKTNQYGYAETIYNGPDLTMRGLTLYTGSLYYSVRACNAVGCSAYGPSASVNLVSGTGGD